MKKLFLIAVIILGAQLFGAKSASAITCTLSVSPTSGASGTSATVNWSVGGNSDVWGNVDFGNGDGDSDSGFKNAGNSVSTTYTGSSGEIFNLDLWGYSETQSCHKPKKFQIGGGGGFLEKCRNGLDDDGDYFIDYPNDGGCTDPTDDSETGGQNPVAYVNIYITTEPEGMRWKIYCPAGPYTCNFLPPGTGSQYLGNGTYAGAGPYSIDGKVGVVILNPGYDCVGTSDFREGTPGGEDIFLDLTCTLVATPTPTATATPTPTSSATPTPTVSQTPTPTPTPNTNPVVSNVHFSEPDYCALGPGGNITWTYSDANSDPQASYQLQVDTNNGFSSPDVDQTVNTSGTSASISNLSFGTSYYLRMRATDNQGGVSSWADMTICTGSGCTGKVIKSWTTPVHRYPNNLNFTWTPANPLANQVVTFDKSTTTCYNSANNPVACASYTWNWADGSPTEIGPNPNPTHTFVNSNTYLVTFRATDSDGYTCPAGVLQKAVIIGKPVPSWKEVIPR